MARRVEDGDLLRMQDPFFPAIPDDNFLRDIPTLWALSCLFPFAAAGMATSTGASAAFAGWVGLLFFWQWVLMSFLRYESLGGFLGGRYYLWFAPFTVLFAVDFLERKAATSRTPRPARRGWPGRCRRPSG